MPSRNIKRDGQRIDEEALGGKGHLKSEEGGEAHRGKEEQSSGKKSSRVVSTQRRLGR